MEIGYQPVHGLKAIARRYEYVRIAAFGVNNAVFIGHAFKRAAGRCADGYYPAPVLAGADVSMAMAGSAPVAQVQADIVFLQDRLMNVPLSLAHARKTMRIVKENLLWALLYNCIAIPLALSGVLTPWIAGLGMALSSIIVLLNATRLQKIKV